MSGTPLKQRWLIPNPLLMSEATEQIKERLNVADIVSEYVPLKRLGAHWKGLCPFHQEKTPSFVVSPDKGFWHCFGCGESGDVFSFVQRMEGLDFRGALQLLAERAGVVLPEYTAAAAGDTRGRLFDILDSASKFYHEILLNQSAGSQAKKYLTERGVTAATMRDFLIGYAPMQWDVIQQALARKGFTISEMIAAGLVGKNDTGRHFDRFRGRIMFPIHDVQGRVVAFGGRIVPWHAKGTEGKYVNSPETAVYHKRRTIYNLHRAKQAIRQQHLGIVVEGYMDVVLLAQAGVAHSVASSGTAFTAEQITQLQRFTTTLHFAFDTDRAGIHAAIAATKAAVAAGMRVATIIFPAGKDPADVVLEEPGKITEYLSRPQSLASVLLRQLQHSDSATNREELLQEILPLIKQTTNMIQQGEMIQEISQQLHVPEAMIMQRVTQQATAAPAPAAANQNAAPSTTLSAEQRLLGLLIVEPAARIVAADITPELLITPVASTLWAELKTVLASDQGGKHSATTIIEALPEAFVPVAEALRAETEASRVPTATAADREARALLRFLRQRHLEQRLRALHEQLSGAGTTPAPDMLRQFQAVAEELEHVKAHS